MLESKIELAKIVNNNNLDLEKFQEYLLTNNLATRLSEIFIKTSNFIFIKFPTSSPSQLTFIKFPAKPLSDAGIIDQVQNCEPRLQLEFKQQMDAKLTSHSSEATGILAEIKRTAHSLNQALTNCNSQPHEFPVPLGQWIAWRKLVNSDHCLNSVKMTWAKILESTWSIKQHVFKCPANPWALPCRNPRMLEYNLGNNYIDEYDTPYELNDDDNYIIIPTYDTMLPKPSMVFTAYKCVGQKIHPVLTQFPVDCEVTRQIPEDPLLTLPKLPMHPPDFTPTSKISLERMTELNVNLVLVGHCCAWQI